MRVIVAVYFLALLVTVYGRDVRQRSDFDLQTASSHMGDSEEHYREQDHEHGRHGEKGEKGYHDHKHGKRVHSYHDGHKGHNDGDQGHHDDYYEENYKKGETEDRFKDKDQFAKGDDGVDNLDVLKKDKMGESGFDKGYVGHHLKGGHSESYH